MDETASNPAVALVLGAVGPAGAVILQFAMRRDVAWVYWPAVVIVCMFVNMAADAVHVVLGVPYGHRRYSFWPYCLPSLSSGSAQRRRCPSIAWTPGAARFSIGQLCFVTFALVTATGDLLTYSPDLSYFGSGLVFAAVIAIAALAYRRGWISAIPAFWFAHILTRPLCASFSDWTAVGADRGGLGWGSGCKPGACGVHRCRGSSGVHSWAAGRIGRTAGLLPGNKSGHRRIFGLYGAAALPQAARGACRISRYSAFWLKPRRCLLPRDESCLRYPSLRTSLR